MKFKWSSCALVRKRICRHFVCDTFEFIEHIKEVNENDKVMLSLDVESSFTNAPLIETINFICMYVNNNKNKSEYLMFI